MGNKHLLLLCTGCMIFLTNLSAQFVEVEKIKGGAFTAGDKSSWIIAKSAAEEEARITFGHSEVPQSAKSKTSVLFDYFEPGIPEMQMYQKISLKGGITYKLSALLKVKGVMDHNWCQLYIGPDNIDPDDGTRFSDAVVNVGDWTKDKTMYLEAWGWSTVVGEPEVDINGPWPIAESEGTNTLEITPEEDGNYMVLIKIGQWSGTDPYKVIIADVSLKGMEPGTAVNNLGNENVLVYPSVFNKVVNFSGMQNAVGVTVYNLLGMKVYQLKGVADQTVDLSSLPSGPYFIQLENNKTRHIQKIIKR